MNQTSDDVSPAVVLQVADEATRRRIEELVHQLSIEASAVVATTAGRDDSDCILPAEASDDALRIAVELAAKLATLRRQLSAARRNETQLARAAATDSLTGLPNRRAWDDAAATTLSDSAAQNRPLCMALLDLDEFKRVNDLHGHAVGDAVLRATAEGLRSAVRRDDVAARLGGDEFGLLLPGLSPENAGAVVERIRLSVHAAIAEAGLPTTTCSVGYASNSRQPYAAASAALQSAKRSGRNRSEASGEG